MRISRKFYKNMNTANPLLSNVFCADPYGIEYEGRLYVYGTNDNQQYKLVGDGGKNTYELIKSIVCFSTDDLVNWTYHGYIDVEAAASFIISSWAPAIVSRREADGLTHFYMYFSNNGCGIGLLTSTNPLGPWTSPLDKPLIETGMKGIEDVSNPFGPGVCIDDKGDAWLSFGAGIIKKGTELYPGTARLVKLGKDMISLASSFVEIKAPYFFEASDLNFINGTYVFSYNNSWVERKEWPYSAPLPPACSMACMVSKTPLIADSWEYKNHYFLNPGEQGLNYSNNHTHLAKYMNQWYILYHTLTLQENTNSNGGFRSICMDKADVDEASVTINLCRGSRKGLSPLKCFNPYEKIPASTIFTSADISYENEKSGSGQIAVKSDDCGAWILVKNIDFNKGVREFLLELKGKGEVHLRVDKISSESISKAEVSSCDYEEVSLKLSASLDGLHDLYFIFSDKELYLRSWIANCFF